ncbi:hypothetical protein BaRGS_00000958 [Batillaria attramentaria]|uniref:Uncharacterized protein n=1 Tax=Batillaria attramentaria TaxID=370345 RepID=A0ABD0M9T0_9CAEN
MLCVRGSSGKLFPGPGGIGDCRAHLLVDSRAIGTNQYSFEGTHDADYLWRPAPGTPFQSPRYKCPGEIGWGSWIRPIEDSKAPNTGHQILTSEFWRQVEDEFTHRFQSPWYWHPTETKTPPGFEKPFGPHGYVPPRPRITRTGTSTTAATGLSLQTRGTLRTATVAVGSLAQHTRDQ